ncbi:hypothetical protein [Rhizobium laguerreae]|uniref:hypothetical protein n=1 Tax=Rhizobium laguerreae TaxID=1076926 RepID=UPI001C9284AE|nr:hypothetical protein [Rhizobium laguerreae]MBY3386308.1 hypothetical protein [Rhizobium laguerreae]MBY3400391.1 hypothetical protein [Rhizobium laguerreae]MBY3407328.1 hypothetical protein [Rhizobium laguerreae]
MFEVPLELQFSPYLAMGRRPPMVASSSPAVPAHAGVVVRYAKSPWDRQAL